MFSKAENGNALGEYGIIIGLMALVAIPALIYLGTTDKQLFGSIGSAASSDNQLLSLISTKQHPTASPAASTPSLTTQASASAIMLSNTSGQLILNIPNTKGAGSNATSVEGQLDQAPKAIQLLADRIAILADQQVANTASDPQLAGLLRQISSTAAGMSVSLQNYNNSPDGVPNKSANDLVQIGNTYTQAINRLNTLAAMNPNVDYTPLRTEVGQLSAAIANIIDHNYLHTPILPGINTNLGSYTPPKSATQLIDLFSDPNITAKCWRLGNTTTPQTLMTNIQNTLTTFQNITIDTSMVNQILSPVKTGALSNTIQIQANRYQNNQSILMNSAQNTLASPVPSA